MDNQEVWKPIKHYETIYQISSFGKVKRNKRIVNKNNGVFQTINEKLLISRKSKGKYHIIYLRNLLGEKKHFFIHQLVANHFLNKINNLNIIIHKDGNACNNILTNLKYSNKYPKNDLPDEIWKDMKGFEYKYEISNLGRINNFFDDCEPYNPFKNSVSTANYIICILYDEKGKMKSKLYHRLLAETFILNPENKAEVNHIDGNKLNNSLNNLEWVTRSENINHALKIGLFKNRKYKNQ